MTGQKRVQRAVRGLLAVVTLPPTVLHEATHALLAAPYARELAVVVEPAGARAMVGIDWRDDVPHWAIVLSAYGPTVVGGLVGVVGAVWLVTGGRPSSGRTWLVSGVLAVWWAIYMMPSESDRTAGKESRN